MDGLTFRFGSPDDAAVIARQRCEMFKEMGVLSEQGYRDLYPASITYFRAAIQGERYIAWLVAADSLDIAGGGMLLLPTPPRPGPDMGLLSESPQGLILNVFVEPAWRRRGVAKSLVKTMIEYANEHRISCLTLHASEAGRPIYQSLGFKPTNEMRLFI